MNPQRIALYARVSSDEQADAETIQNQVNYAEKYVDLNKLAVVDWYLDEGVSGTIPLGERQQGKRLLADAKAGKLDVVLVYRVDRLARRLKVLLDAHEALQLTGVAFRSMTEPIDTSTPIGRFILQLLGSIAELERETIIERSVMGTNRRAAEGKWLGGLVPYGYTLDAEHYLAINDAIIPGHDLSEADIVRLCYRLLVEDQRSCVQIADYLNGLNVPPVSLGPNKRTKRLTDIWTPFRIYDMVRQSTYQGVHYYGRRTKKARELIEREVPAIVSAETWEAAQRQLTANQIHMSPQNATRDYLLRGLIKCGTCGLTYCGGVGLKSRGGPYYRCNGKARHRGKLDGRCSARVVNAEHLEAEVWGKVCEYAENPEPVIDDLRARLNAGVGDQRSIHQESEQIEAAIGRKERERDQVVRLLRQEIIPYHEGEKHLSEIAREIGALQGQRSALFARLETTVEVETRLLKAEQLLAGLRERVANADNETKRRIIQGLVNGIVVETLGEGQKKSAKVIISWCFDVAVLGTGQDSQKRDNRLLLETVWATSRA